MFCLLNIISNFTSYSEPLFAELQQTLWTNEIKIYQEYVVKGTHQVKKLYYFAENCNEKLDITEVCTGVLVQLLCINIIH